MSSDSLKIELQLTIANEVFSIPGANVKNCRLNLYSFGFEGRLDFWTSSGTGEDDLFPNFVKPDLIEARLAITAVHHLPSPEPEPLLAKGIVTDKSVREISYKDVSGNPVLQRHYRIQFKDAPQVLWKQHFPTELYTEKSVAEVLAAHAVEGISLELEWDRIRQKLAMLCLPLGNETSTASFYDFLQWVVCQQHGVLAYNYKTQALRLSDHKARDAAPISFSPQEIDDLAIRFPEIRRQNIRLLNACTESARKIDITQDQAVSGVVKDILLRTDIIKEMDSRKRLETAKLNYRKPEVDIHLKQFPVKTFRVGTWVKFDTALWPGKTFHGDRLFRVREIRLTAAAKEPAADQNLNAGFGVYDLQMTARMESVDDPAVQQPLFAKPTYPIFVEGTVISESGKDTDKTYQIYSDKTTSRDCYTVHVPLWNRKIRVPFIPDMTSGHFYFPAFKHARVLLAVYYDHAEIDAFLDWGEGARLSLDTQGNHILFGKNPASETSVKHIYKDNKPVFSIHRVAGVDTELIQLEEKAIILQTKEDRSRDSGEDRYNLTPKVAAARAQLAMDKEAAAYKVSAAFKSTKSEVSAKIDAALADSNARLESMESEISARIEALNADIESSMQRLTQSTGRLKRMTDSIKAEIRTKVRL